MRQRRGERGERGGQERRPEGEATARRFDPQGNGHAALFRAGDARGQALSRAAGGRMGVGRDARVPHEWGDAVLVRQYARYLAADQGGLAKARAALVGRADCHIRQDAPQEPSATADGRGATTGRVGHKQRRRAHAPAGASASRHLGRRHQERSEEDERGLHAHQGRS